MTFSYHSGENKVQVIKLAGPLLGRRTEELENMFGTLSGQGIRQVIVDLAEVPFIDSRGLAILVTGYRMFGSQPQNFRLAALQDQPQLVLQLTGFDHIFHLFETVSEAMYDEVAMLPPLGQVSSHVWPPLDWRSTSGVSARETISVRG